jgi:RNA polymerase sigma-70 factor, ECF subfamily
MEHPDNILIKKLKDEDVSAFDELYKRYHSKVFQLARRFLPYKEDAEEIVQAVFVAVWENRIRIEEDKSFSSYILSIARHTIYNALRKAVYRQAYIEYLGHNNTENAYVTEDIVLFNELESHLHDIIEKLPPRCREITRLHHKDGLSYKEIAARLSISISTINTHLTKALNFIRQQIRQQYRDNTTGY